MIHSELMNTLRSQAIENSKLCTKVRGADQSYKADSFASSTAENRVWPQSSADLVSHGCIIAILEMGLLSIGFCGGIRAKYVLVECVVIPP